MLLAVALVAAAFVVTGLRLPPPAAAGIAALAGLAIGIDAQPEASSLLPLLVAGGASLLGGTALAMVVVALALGRGRHWQRVAARVAASWIAASAILYFGWLRVPPPG